MTNKILIVILLLVSCNSNKNQTHKFINESLSKSNEFIYEKLGEKNNMMEYMIHASPKRTKKYKDITVSVYSEIERINMIANSSNTNKLNTHLRQLKIFADSLSNTDSILKQSLDNANSISHIGHIKEQELLPYRANILGYYILKRIVQKTMKPPFNPRTITSKVVPKKIKLHTNELFEAEVSLFAYDTASVIRLLIDGQEFKGEKGIIHYIDSINNKTGKISKSGTLVWEKPNCDDDYKYQVLIDYTVESHE